MVEYVNTLPLAHGLERFVPGAEVIADTPGALAGAMAAGRLDLGLVPVASLEGSDWPVVSGLGICSRGPVASVLLLADGPVDDIERVAFDPASRTSNRLVAMWLAHHERPVRWVDAPGDAAARLGAAGATVVIGDEALFWDTPVTTRVDLGEAWAAWTGLPFVFAVWAGPAGSDSGLADALHRCYAHNRERLDALADHAAGGDPARGARFRQYLTQNIHYDVGERERAGWAAYRERLEAVPAPPYRGTRHVHSA